MLYQVKIFNYYYIRQDYLRLFFGLLLFISRW